MDYSFAEGSPLEGVGIGAGVRYVGQRYGYASYGTPAVLHTYDLDGVTLFDAALTYKKEGVTASLNLRNLADKEYIASCSSFGCTYGDGRTVMGKLTFNW
jgi:iron complex outermembrane receptor protein